MNNSANTGKNNPNQDDDFFDDSNSDIDVPVYRREAGQAPTEAPAEAAPVERDPYEMAGRARPQRIEAKPKEAKPKKEQVKEQPVQEQPLQEPAQPAQDNVQQPSRQRVDEKPMNQQPMYEAEQDAPTTAIPVAAATPAGNIRNGVAGDRGMDDGTVRDGNMHGDTMNNGAVRDGAVRDDAVRDDTVRDDTVREDEQKAVMHKRDKRGTLGFGLLLLRLLVGGWLLVQGLQYLFAFGGNDGLNSFEGVLSNYSGADLLAVGLSVGMVVAGGLLVLGLLTPFGAALGAVVAGFMALHFFKEWNGGLFPSTLDPQVQLYALLAGASMALLFTGPGRASLDRSRGWATRPLASAWLFALVAVAGLVALWFFAGGGNPLN